MFNDVHKVFSQFLRLHYLNGIPKRKDVLLEVIVWGEIVGEDAMVAVRFDLLLATVQRQGAEVADLLAIDLQENLLRFHIVVLAYAV